MAELTVQNISKAGLEATYAAASAGGDSFPNNDRTFLHVKNGDASDHTVTITAQKSVVAVGNGYGTLALSNISVVVTAGEERLISAPPSIFNDGNGKAQVTYDDVTSVTVAAIQRKAD